MLAAAACAGNSAFANRLHRAGVALKDRQGLGGWKTSATLVVVSLQADDEVQRRALALDDSGTGTRNWHITTTGWKERRPARRRKFVAGQRTAWGFEPTVRYERTRAFQAFSLGLKIPT